MLIYTINFSLLTLFFLLIYIFCGRGLTGRAGCRQTEVQTNKQTDRRSLSPTPKNWRIHINIYIYIYMYVYIYIYIQFRSFHQPARMLTPFDMLLCLFKIH